jgi:tRNA(Ile)-lysidine synthase
MASSRKPRSADPGAVALSGGVDSVVLLHLLKARGVRAIHVHHGLSPNADAWAQFCRRLCRQWKVPLTVRRVRVARAGKGPEAAARAARYGALKKSPFDVLFLAHHLDDQAETVLMNLLRGAGAAGARGMPAVSRLEGKALVRPLLDVPRSEILAYAKRHRLEWIEDESNADEALTRNFVRRRVGPLLDERFPGWRRALGRAARHFASRELRAQDLLREFLRARGLKAPSEAKLLEMLRQLTSRGARTSIEHDGARLRVYRNRVFLEARRDPPSFRPLTWRGEARLPIPALGGELRFRRVRGRGIDSRYRPLQVRLRSGGERLKPDARRPRRTLKNLFQEAGIAPWERDRLPLLYCGEDLVWVAGLGVEARYQAPRGGAGLMPEWRCTL